MRTRRSVLVAGFVGLVVCWVLATIVAIDDIDFFDPRDFFDTTALHHEHVFVLLVFLGAVALGVSIAIAGRRRRAGSTKSEQ